MTAPTPAGDLNARRQLRYLQRTIGREEDIPPMRWVHDGPCACGTRLSVYNPTGQCATCWRDSRR